MKSNLRSLAVLNVGENMGEPFPHQSLPPPPPSVTKGRVRVTKPEGEIHRCAKTRRENKAGIVSTPVVRFTSNIPKAPSVSCGLPPPCPSPSQALLRRAILCQDIQNKPSTRFTSTLPSPPLPFLAIVSLTDISFVFISLLTCTLNFVNCLGTGLNRYGRQYIIINK